MRENATVGNLTQRTPYISSEQHNYQREHDALCDALQEVFQWIRNKVRIFLPFLLNF